MKDCTYMTKTTVTYKKIWSIAWPIILGSIAQNIITVTDTAFIGRVGEIALGSVAIGALLYFAFIMLGFGFGIGAQIMVARRHGEGNDSKIGPVIEHALRFLIPLSIIMVFILKTGAPTVLGWMVQSPNILTGALEYIDVRAWGLLFAFVNISIRAFYVGIADTRIITWTTMIMAAINVFLDYALIFGKFGLPQMGIAGAAMASVIAEASAMIFFIAHTWYKADRERYRLFHFTPFNADFFMHIIKIASPVMAQNFISLSTWFTFFILIENMGETPIAISNIIRSVYVVMMIPIWGFSSAVNTLVSHAMGRGAFDEIPIIIKKVMKLCIMGIIPVVAIITLFPVATLRFYTNVPHLINGSVTALYVVALGAITAAMGFTVFSAVSGTGKTVVALILEIIVLAIYIITAWLLSQVYHFPIAIVWSVEILYGLLLFIGSTLYLSFPHWRHGTL